MPFKKAFERQMNDNMQDHESSSDRGETHDEEVDFEKQHPPRTPQLDVEDAECAEKKDLSLIHI